MILALFVAGAGLRAGFEAWKCDFMAGAGNRGNNISQGSEAFYLGQCLVFKHQTQDVLLKLDHVEHQELFATARRMSPAVILIDELRTWSSWLQSFGESVCPCKGPRTTAKNSGWTILGVREGRHD